MNERSESLFPFSSSVKTGLHRTRAHRYETCKIIFHCVKTITPSLGIILATASGKRCAITSTETKSQLFFAAGKLVD